MAVPILSLLVCAAVLGSAVPVRAQTTPLDVAGPEELLFYEIPMVAMADRGVPGAPWSGALGDQGSAPEQLLFDEIPIVISSTRTELLATDVPNPVTVITADEIRSSGAVNLADVLQTVPGLDLMRVTNSDLAVSVRGFNASANSNLLVMVDGRSVYLDFLGNVLWDDLPVPLQDIERIEVIRGPGSVLFGANALLGTINIITKHPRDLPTAHFRTAVGQRTNLATSTVAHHTPRLSLKASGQYEQRSSFRNDVNPAGNAQRDRHDTSMRTKYGSAALYLRPADDFEIRMAGGIQHFNGDLLLAGTTLDGDGHQGWAELDLERGPWKLQAFYSRFSDDNSEVLQFPPLPAVPGRFSVLSTTTDLDLQRTFEWANHEMVFGGNVRRVMTDSDVVLGSREEDMTYGAFVHDEIELSDRLTAFLGLRLDRESKTGWNASPRASLVYKLGETERLRIGFSRAFRNPTQIFTYFSQNVIPGLFTLQGNDDLDPVQLTAYDIGIEGRLHPRLHAQLDLFYNILSDFTISVPLTVPPPAVVGFRNSGRTTTWGGEVALDWTWSDKLRAFGSYSFQSAHGPFEHATPRHKASGGLRGKVTSRLRYALTGSYVGHTQFEEGTPTISAVLGTAHATRIRSRFTVDAFLGVRLWRDVEMGLHARNVFNQVRRHHPLGDEIGSELLVTLTGEF
jgi:iron complex outermembrane receptor protein